MPSTTLLLALCLAVYTVLARSPVAHAETVPVPSTLAGLADASAKAKTLHCDTDDCKSMILLDYLVNNIQLFEAGDANGVASIMGRGRIMTAGRRLDYHFLRHRELYRPMCAFSVRYLQNIKGPLTGDDPLYAYFVPTQIFLNAVDMDVRDGGHCTEQVTPFFLNTQAGREVRHKTYEFCINEDANHRRPAAICNLIADDKVPPDERHLP